MSDPMARRKLSAADPRRARRAPEDVAHLLAPPAKRRPAALVGTIIFCFFLFLAVFGPWVAPYDYQAQDAKLRLGAPSLVHPFGADQFGRDIFSRVIVGTRNIFLLGGLGTLVAVVIGTAIGLASGYVGGPVDEVSMRLLDVLLSFPSLLLALVLLSAVGPSNLNIVLVVAILYIPMVARVVRSMVLDLKTKEFVEAARVRGERRSYILFREILPNSLPPLLVEASMRFSYSIFLVASLGFWGSACSRRRLTGGCRSTRRATSSPSRPGRCSSRPAPSPSGDLDQPHV